MSYVIDRPRPVPSPSAASHKRLEQLIPDLRCDADAIVHLPIAAMNEREDRCLRIGSEKQIEPLARAPAVVNIEMTVLFTPHTCVACRASRRELRVALGDGGAVVVGTVELGAVHSAIKHLPSLGSICRPGPRSFPLHHYPSKARRISRSEIISSRVRI